MFKRVIITTVFILVFLGIANSREPTGSLFDKPPVKKPHVIYPILGATLGGVLGFGGGMIISRPFMSIADDWGEGLIYGILGLYIGESLGVATGAHIGNNKRGNYFLTTLTSFGSLAASTVLILNSNPKNGAVYLTIPFIHVLTTVLVERTFNKID